MGKEFLGCNDFFNRFYWKHHGNKVERIWNFNKKKS